MKLLNRFLSLISVFVLVFSQVSAPLVVLAQEVIPSVSEGSFIETVPQEEPVGVSPEEQSLVLPTPTSTPAPVIESTPLPTPVPETIEETQHMSAIITENSADFSDSVFGPIGQIINAFLTTDKADYSPTEKAVISGSGFNPDTTYTLVIISQDEPTVHFEAPVTTNSDGEFTYSYQLDGNYRPNYKVELKDADGKVIAQTSFTDGISITLYTDTSHTGQGYQFALGDTVFAQAAGLDTSHGYKFDVKDLSGSVISGTTTACITGDAIPGNNYVTTAVSDNRDFTFELHEWNSSTCSGGESGGSPKTKTFNVAQATAYVTSSLTTTTSSYAAGATAYVVINGLDRSKNDWKYTWIKPDASTACANTAGNAELPDSSNTGTLPDAIPTYLQYQPTTSGGLWNDPTKYDANNCPAFASGNAGQWKLTLTKDSTHFVTLNVFTIDTTVPTGTFTINDNDSYTDTRNVNLNFSSVSSDVAQLEIRNGTTGSFQSPVTYANPYSYTLTTGDGTKTVSVRFTDSAGNQSVGIISDTIILDTIAPTLTQITPVSTSTSDNTPNYTFNSNEAGTITYGGDCISLATNAVLGNNTVTFSALKDGTYNNCTIQVTDPAGNQSSALNVSAFTIDTTVPELPTITDVGGTDNIINSAEHSQIVVRGTAEANSLVRVTLEDENGNNVSENQQLADGNTGYSINLNGEDAGLEDGTVSVTVTAKDAAGNVSNEQTTNVTQDTSAPNLNSVAIASNNSNPSFAKVGNTITLNFISDEPIQTPTVTIAGNTATVGTPDDNNWSATYTMVSGDTAGNVGFNISFSDIAGNPGSQVSTTNNSSSVTFDKTAPTTPSANPPAGDYFADQQVVLSSSDTGGSGVASIYYTTDGTTPSLTNGTLFTGAIAVNKDMTIKAIAYDVAGNPSSVLSAVYGIAPVISAEAVSGGTTTDTSTTITWTTDDLATSRVIYDTASHTVLGAAPNYGYANSTVETDTAPKVLAHSVAISGLAASTTYYYRTVSHGSPESVSTEHSVGTTSTPSSSSSGDGGGGAASMPGAPACNDSKPGSAPTLVSATSGTNSVTLSWTKAADPTTYYLVTYGNGPGLQQYGNPSVGGADVTTYTVSGLSGGATYYFRVRAGNGCAPGDYSNEVSATPGGGFIEGPAAGFIPGVLGTQTEEQTQGEIKGEEISASPSPVPTQPTQPSVNIFEAIGNFFKSIFNFFGKILGM